MESGKGKFYKEGLMYGRSMCKNPKGNKTTITSLSFCKPFIINISLVLRTRTTLYYLYLMHQTYRNDYKIIVLI